MFKSTFVCLNNNNINQLKNNDKYLHPKWKQINRFASTRMCGLVDAEFN